MFICLKTHKTMVLQMIRHIILITSVGLIVGNPVSLNTDESNEEMIVTRLDTVALICNESLGTNSTNISVTWFHNDIQIESSNHVKLLISNFEEKDVGKYHCISESKGRKKEGKIIELKLKPYLDVSAGDAYPLSISKDQAQKTDFQAICYVESYPKADVSFYRNNEMLSESERITIDKTLIDGEHGKLIKYIMVISNISAPDIGDYYCKVSNSELTEKVYINSISVEVTCNESDTWQCPYTNKCVSKFSCKKLSDCVLYYCDIPFPPRNFRILSRDHQSLSLTWDRGDRVLEYLIKLKSNNEPTVYIQTEENIMHFKKLKNHTEYLLQISAMNKAGRTDYVNFRFKTERMVPPNKVDQFEVLRHDKNDEVLLKWSAPFDDGMENRKGDVRYELVYCIYHKESEREEECNMKYTHDTSIKVANVKDGSLYYFKVRSINKANQYGKSNEFFYTYNRKRKAPQGNGNILVQPCIVVSLTMIFLTIVVSS